MFRQLYFVAALGLAIMTASQYAQAKNYPSELAPMVAPLEEVETMLANGTFANGEFSPAVSNRDAVTFAKTIEKKLQTAKSEYTRLPRVTRTSKEADKQWYRMDGLKKISKDFRKALQRHARTATVKASTQSTSNDPVAAQRAAEAAQRKKAADARATAIRAQQEATRARAAAVKEEKKAAAKEKAEGVEQTGPNWQNSYIPNIQELESRDGFFQWPWSAPSWKAVIEKAEKEQEKGELGSEQVELFKNFVLDKTDEWPAVSQVQNAGDAKYALDMISKTESEGGLNIVDLWISRGDWKIQRNALGVILSRTKPGHILYEDPSGEGCILKQLWIKELYAGGTNYEKTSKWRYAKLRFQSCDRR